MHNATGFKYDLHCLYANADHPSISQVGQWTTGSEIGIGPAWSGGRGRGRDQNKALVGVEDRIEMGARIRIVEASMLPGCS